MILDVSNISQGYFIAQSDSSDLTCSLQIISPSGVLYSYFIAPGESATVTFTEAAVITQLPVTNRYRVTSMQLFTAKQLPYSLKMISAFSLSKSICKLYTGQQSQPACALPDR